MTVYFTRETFTPVDQFTRDVQIDRAEFLRQLPEAVENRPFNIDGELVTINEGSGVVCIRMSDLGIERKGQLELPMMRLDFAFQGLSDEQIDSFMDTYDQRTLRGSGGM